MFKANPPYKESAREIKIMTYNVWGAREDVALFRRMQAIRDLVHHHKPDVILFQEVTVYIVRIFDSLDIFKVYKHGRSFPSKNDEECFCLLLSKLPLDRFDCSAVKVCPSCYYLHAWIKPGSGMTPIHMATARLQSLSSAPEVTCGGHDRFCMAEQLVSELDGEENVLLGGDMCWDDDVDLPFPLRSGWVDAWTQLNKPRADLASSWTYDAFWNEEVGGFNGFMAPPTSTKKRSDRFVCKLKDYDVKSIEAIGSDGVGIQYRKVNSRHPWECADLLPSCHRGLVLTIAPNGPARVGELDCESPDGRTVFGDQC